MSRRSSVCPPHQGSTMSLAIKRGNVLVKREEDNKPPTAVVGDFGLACKIPDPLDEDQNQLTTVGSPFWIAPECINGKKYNQLADVFSYGIILCELIARVEADPDVLPRTQNFGLDYVAFSKMVEDCPLNFLHLAFNCCQIDPKKRPTFCDLVQQLEEICSRSQMDIVLADISSMGAGEIMNKTILEKILDGRGHRRNRSDESIHFHSHDLDGMDMLNPPDNFLPVTPLIVGQVMSKDDVFYTPHIDNPFLKKFPDLPMKLVGGGSWLSSAGGGAWSDLPSPSYALTPPCTPHYMIDSGSEQWVYMERRGSHRPSRNCHSLPGSPPLGRRELAEAMSPPVHFSRSGVGLSAGRGQDEDACSDGSSSTDSALGMDMLLKDLRASRYLRKQLSSSHNARHLSIDPSFLSPSLSSPSFSPALPSRTELLARFMEAKLLDRSGHPSSRPDLTRSYSSSESCMSLDEASMLSPTSSYSSYTDAAEDLCSRAAAAQLELYEHRLRSRQKFQELVASWEAKHAADSSDDQLTGERSPAPDSQHSSGSVSRLGRQYYIHEHSDPHIEKKFQELRRKWEMKQLSVSRDSSKRAAVAAVAAAAAAANNSCSKPAKK